MDLTLQDITVLLQIIGNGRYTPDEWEGVVKPIVIKLQEEQNDLT
jgi:hypothetical protein